MSPTQIFDLNLWDMILVKGHNTIESEKQPESKQL